MNEQDAVVGKFKGVDHDGNFFHIKCSPDKPVVVTGPGERALGKMFEVETLNEPRSQAEVDLAGDTFMHLWKQSPTISEPPQERAVNKLLLEWAASQPGFSDGRTSTVGNIPAALASAGLLWESLMNEQALKDALEKQKEAEEKQKEAEQHYEQAAQQLADGDQQGAEQSKQQGDQAQQQADAMAQQAAQKVEKMKNNPLAQGMMGVITKKAAEKGKEVATACKSWGVEPDNVTQEEAEEIMRFADDKQMLEIAELIGRFHNISARAIEAAKAGYTGVVAEPQITKDITRLFPMEKAMLSQNAPQFLRVKYASRFLRGGLLGWKPKHEGKKMGAFVAYVDKSGSMGGLQFSIAKGIALGIAKAVKEDDSIVDRFYSLHYFDSSDPQSLPHTTSEDSWRKHLDWGRMRAGGGTVFDNAFEDAIRVLREAKANGVIGADLLFITDEESYISDETKMAWYELSNQIGTQLHVVSITSYGEGLSSLRDMAETVIQVNSVAFKDKAENIVEQVTTAIIKGELK